MRLHSDKITESDVYRATRASGMHGVFVEMSEHGSRIRDHAFEVKLTGTSNRRPNSGQCGAGDDYAATWDEWGMFLADLFSIDPRMVAGQSGRPAYDGAENFHGATWGRFETLTADNQHKSHTWNINPHPDVRACVCGAAIHYDFMWNKRENGS